MALTTQKILDLYQLDRFFPEEEGEISEELKLHYLILEGKCEAAAIWLKDHPQLAAIKEPYSLLTPLHLCSILGELNIAKDLLTYSEVSVAATDCRQWTPLHQAALREEPEMLDLLLAADKAKQCGAAALKNQNGGTYADLRRMAFPQEGAVVLQFCDADGEIIAASAKEFQEKTQARFASHMHATPSFFMEEWADPTEMSDADLSISDTVKPDYEHFVASPPPLHFKQTPAGYGVFCSEDTPEGTVVLDYLGEASRDESESLYLMPRCDGTRVRNFGPLTNDGFPNCVDVRLCHVSGFPFLHVFRTICPIKRGEQLLWNYGTRHPVKSERHLEFGKEQAERWFREKSLIEHYRDLGEAGQVGDLMSFRNFLTPIHYILSTRSLQIPLLLKRLVFSNELLFVMAQDFFQKREGELFILDEVNENISITNNLFEMCKTSEKREEMEKQTAVLMEGLFSMYQVPTVIDLFKTIILYQKNWKEWIGKIVQGDIEGKNKLILMAKDLEAQMQKEKDVQGTDSDSGD